MQSDIYVDKDYDKTGHGAMKHSENHVLLKFCGDVYIEILHCYKSYNYMGLNRNA